MLSENTKLFLGGRYEVSKVIGKGSFGEVYVGYDHTEQHPVVIKVSQDELAGEVLETAIKEATVLASLHHPFIVRFYGSWVSDHRVCIAMEPCSAGDLARVIQFHARTREAIPEATIRLYLVQLLMALNYIHGLKLIHRDFKAANILLHDEANHTRVKLADFGLCRQLHSTVEMAQTRVGSPLYVAPEVICDQKDRAYNQKADVWSLGVLLYELMTLRCPFVGDCLPQIFHRIQFEDPPEITATHGVTYSQEMRRLCMEMLNKNPRLRASTQNMLNRPWLANEVKDLAAQLGHDLPAIGAENAEREALAWVGHAAYEAILNESQVLQVCLRFPGASSSVINVRAEPTADLGKKNKIGIIAHGTFVEATNIVTLQQNGALAHQWLQITWRVHDTEGKRGQVLSGFCWARHASTGEGLFVRFPEHLVRRPSGQTYVPVGPLPYTEG